MKKNEKGFGPVYEYLEKHGLKHAWAARKMGICSRTVSALCHGHKVTPIIAKAVEKFTKGKVKAKDICLSPEVFKNKKVPRQQEFEF